MVWAYDNMLAYWWKGFCFFFKPVEVRHVCVLCLQGPLAFPAFTHAFIKLQQRPGIFWLFFCVCIILKEPVALSKLASSC